MSSYINSAFALEERRLQGIVNQCSQELGKAMQELESQMEHMERQEREQQQRDDAYEGNQEAALQQLLQQMEREQQEHRLQRNEIFGRLRAMEIQIKAYHRINGGMESAMERQSRLQRQFEEQRMDAEILVEEIVRHGEQVMEEMKQISEEKSAARLRDSVSAQTQFQAGKKGVSLQRKQETVTDKPGEENPLSLFVRRLQEAVHSEHAKKLPSILKLERELEEQPEYARTAFAVRNMGRLEELLAQLDKIKEKNTGNKAKWQQMARRYRAVCFMLGEEPEQRLLSDYSHARSLQQAYRECCHRYQVKKEREYIFHAVTDVMGRHGILMTCPVTEDVERSSMEFMLDAHANLFVKGGQGKSISMEVSGVCDGRTPTLEEKRKSVASAVKFCSVIKNVERELKEEYGILFENTWTEEPSEETIHMEQSSVAADSGRHYAANKPKAAYLD